MALSIVGSVTVGSSDGVGTTPTGAASGDLLLFFVAAFGGGGTTSITPPGGTSLVTSNSYNETTGGGVTTFWCYKLPLSGAPAGTYTFTLNPAGSFGGTAVYVICFRDAGTPTIDSGAGAPTTAHGSVGGDAVYSIPGLTTSVNNEIVVCANFGDDSHMDIPAGFASQYNNNTSVPGAWAFVATESIAVAGATGTITGNTNGVFTGKDDWIGILVAVQPSSGGGGISVPFWAAP